MPDSHPVLEPNLRQPAPALGPRARRTMESILAATRELMLERGYGGTAVDDITQRAGVSRASFYTYFPSKRDALLALGRTGTTVARESIDELAELPENWAITDLEQWMWRNHAFFDDYGHFGIAWAQATHGDPELREAGTATHLRTCQQLGAALNRLRGTTLTDDTTLGLLVFSMLEQAWTQRRMYEPAITVEQIVRSFARVLAELLRP